MLQTFFRISRPVLFRKHLNFLHKSTYMMDTCLKNKKLQGSNVRPQFTPTTLIFIEHFWYFGRTFGQLATLLTGSDLEQSHVRMWISLSWSRDLKRTKVPVVYRSNLNLEFQIYILGEQRKKICFYSHPQCCGAKIISFSSGSVEPQIRIVATAPAPAQVQNSFIRYLENCLFLFD